MDISYNEKLADGTKQLIKEIKIDSTDGKDVANITIKEITKKWDENTGANKYIEDIVDIEKLEDEKIALLRRIENIDQQLLAINNLIK